MKKCPKCGSAMGSNVNFCTACGTDLRKISVGQESEYAQSRQKEPGQVQSGMPQWSEVSQNNVQEGTSQSSLSSYWQWCLDSWKSPAKNTMQAERWYGWVTILIEDLLIVLGLYFCANTILHAAMSFSNTFEQAGRALDLMGFSFSIVFKVLFFILLYEAIIIGSYYLAHKFIYNRNVEFFDFINRGVHASNLNLIFSIIFFLLMLMGPGSVALALVLLVLISLLFSMGQQVVLLGDMDAKRDKVYGFLIAFGINLAGMLILFSLLYQTVIGQMMSYRGI